jgi:hypothetical protein
MRARLCSQEAPFCRRDIHRQFQGELMVPQPLNIGVQYPGRLLLQRGHGTSQLSLERRPIKSL